jgi:5-methylcytosine-specific restriction endonuclease McrA
MSDVPTTKRKPMSTMRRLRIWEAHGGICILCARKIDGTREKWIVEHVRALVLGGADDDANCRPAHEDCRRIKDKVDVAMGAKAKRIKARHLGIRKPSQWQSKFKRKVNGQTVLRNTP